MINDQAKIGLPPRPPTPLAATLEVLTYEATNFEQPQELTALGALFCDDNNAVSF